MYGLSAEDLDLQARARGFADELIPFEEQAEQNSGELPLDITAGHIKRARELGLYATNMPSELGGGGRPSLQQVHRATRCPRQCPARGRPPSMSWLPVRG